MPDRTFREILEDNLLKRLVRLFHVTLRENDCHPAASIPNTRVEQEIKAVLDWPSVEVVLDQNIEALGQTNALPSPAKRPFVSGKYNALDAMPMVKDAFEERLLSAYQTDSTLSPSTSTGTLSSRSSTTSFFSTDSTDSSVSNEASTDVGSEESFVLSDEAKEEAHQHFLTALAAEREVLDRRVYHTHDRDVRRHDSLSRILTFNARNSVCTAITVHEGRLIVSANSSGELSSDVLAQGIVAKLGVLKAFLDVAETFPHENEDFEAEVERAAGLLVAQNGISGTAEELKQALRKLYRSSQGEPSELLDAEIVLLGAIRNTDRLTVLLPSWKITDQAPQVDAPGLKVYQKERATDSLALEGIHAFDPELQLAGTEKISSFHAEQLLTVYLERVLGVNLRGADGEYVFGISKLACADCERAMVSRAGVRTRGTSGQPYDSAAYITSPGSSGVKRRRPIGDTNPVNSPPDSAMKHRRREERSSELEIGDGMPLMMQETADDDDVVHGQVVLGARNASTSTATRLFAAHFGNATTSTVACEEEEEESITSTYGSSW